jgi:hypothetical protein
MVPVELLERSKFGSISYASHCVVGQLAGSGEPYLSRWSDKRETTLFWFPFKRTIPTRLPLVLHFDAALLILLRLLLYFL